MIMPYHRRPVLFSKHFQDPVKQKIRDFFRRFLYIFRKPRLILTSAHTGRLRLRCRIQAKRPSTAQNVKNTPRLLTVPRTVNSLPLPFDPLLFVFYKYREGKDPSRYLWCRWRGSVSRLDGARSSAALDRPPDGQFTSAPLRPPPHFNKHREGKLPPVIYGAGGGGRTRTSLRTTDFESVTSAYSITPANIKFSHFESVTRRSRAPGVNDSPGTVRAGACLSPQASGAAGRRE